MDTISGGCECGGVRFQVAGELRDVVNCHCGQCRRTHGHYGAYSGCKLENLAFDNDETLTWYDSSDEARRGFCNRCGGSLFFEFKGSGSIAISAGMLDEPTGLKTSGDIYLASKGDYYDVPDQGGFRYEGSHR